MNKPDPKSLVSKRIAALRGDLLQTLAKLDDFELEVLELLHPEVADVPKKIDLWVPSPLTGNPSLPLLDGTRIVVFSNGGWGHFHPDGTPVEPTPFRLGPYPGDREAFEAEACRLGLLRDPNAPEKNEFSALPVGTVVNVPGLGNFVKVYDIDARGNRTEPYWRQLREPAYIGINAYMLRFSGVTVVPEPKHTASDLDCLPLGSVVMIANSEHRKVREFWTPALPSGADVKIIAVPAKPRNPRSSVPWKTAPSPMSHEMDQIEAKLDDGTRLVRAPREPATPAWRKSPHSNLLVLPLKDGTYYALWTCSFDESRDSDIIRAGVEASRQCADGTGPADNDPVYIGGMSLGEAKRRVEEHARSKGLLL